MAIKLLELKEAPDLKIHDKHLEHGNPTNLESNVFQPMADVVSVNRLKDDVIEEMNDGSITKVENSSSQSQDAINTVEAPEHALEKESNIERSLDEQNKSLSFIARETWRGKYHGISRI